MKTTCRFLFLLIGMATVAAQAQHLNFKHVIVIVQENRTPDNLFQGLCAPPYGSPSGCSTIPTGSQYNIQTRNWFNKASTTGTTQPSALALASKYDMTHTHSAFVAMCDADPNSGACHMDGAAKVPCTPACPKDTAFSFVSNTTGILNPY